MSRLNLNTPPDYRTPKFIKHVTWKGSTQEDVGVGVEGGGEGVQIGDTDLLRTSFVVREPLKDFEEGTNNQRNEDNRNRTSELHYCYAFRS